MQTSFKSKIFRGYIRLKGIKTRLERDFNENKIDERLQTAAAIPEKVQRQCDIRIEKTPEGRTVWQLTPKGAHTKRYIFYIHGGGFVYNITKYDWRLLYRIIQATGYGVIVPDYPLAPSCNYKDVYAMITPVYETSAKRIGSENMVIMGFSAGAGIALSFTQSISCKSALLPCKIILMSPLLDATLQNPQIKMIDKYDPYLGIAGTKMALSAYAGGGDLSNYLISPINGTLTGLPPVFLFCGTHEITLPDVMRLVSMATKQRIPLTYYEYPKMYHAWVFLDMPEAKSVFNLLVRILSDTGNELERNTNNTDTSVTI